MTKRDFFSKKMPKTYCQFRKKLYFCTPFQTRGEVKKKQIVLSHHAGITQLVE